MLLLVTPIPFVYEEEYDPKEDNGNGYTRRVGGGVNTNFLNQRWGGDVAAAKGRLPSYSSTRCMILYFPNLRLIFELFRITIILHCFLPDFQRRLDLGVVHCYCHYHCQLLLPLPQVITPLHISSYKDF